MTRVISKAMILALLLGGTTVSRGSEADELREKAGALQKAAAFLAQTGIREVAERLEREARELKEEAERREAQAGREAPRPDIEREIGRLLQKRLQERLQDLLAKKKRQVEANAPELEQAFVREQIGSMERELKALKEHLPTESSTRPEVEAQVRKIEEAGRRLQHIRIAAENLKAAGVHDLALKLTEKADTLEREIREAKEHLARGMNRPGGPDPRDAEIHELREQNERLHGEVHQLREKLERR